MVINEDLTFAQKAQGRRNLLLFSLFNGISHICITGNILVLFLLKAGCQNYIAVVIASFFYIGSIAVVFSKFFISKWGAASTMSITLLFRGLATLSLASAPFLAIYLNHIYIMLLLLIFSFIYYIFRSIGAPAMRPLFSELTDEDNKGKFTSSYFLYYNIAMLIFIVVSYFLLKHNNDLFMFQIVISIGAVTNLLCSYLLSTIQETTSAEKSSREVGFKSIYKNCWKNKPVRTFFIARACSIAVCAIIVQVSIIALKDIYHVSDSFALIFTIIELAGSIILTYISKMISEYTGPKPLMLIYVLCLIIISALWLIAPHKINILHTSLIFFLGGISISGLTASSFHYFLLITPEKKTVGYSLMFSIVTGIIAGLAGIIIGGGLIKLLAVLHSSHFLIYKYFYCFMLLLCVPVLYLLARLKNFTNYSVTNVFGLLLSPKDLSTLYFVNKIEKYDSVEKESENVEKLLYNQSNLSEKSILYYLKSPLSLIRIRALKSLFNKKISQKTQEALLNELKYGEHSTGFYAAHILGRNKVREAIPLLREYLHSEDNMLKAYSILSLAYLKDEESYQTIENIFKSTNIPVILLKGAIAISEIDSKDLIKLILNKLTTVDVPCILKCEMLYYIAKNLGIGDEFYKFSRHYSLNKRDGVFWISDMLKQNKNLKGADRKVEEFFNNEICKCEIINYLHKNLIQYKIEAKELIEVIQHTKEEGIINEIIYLMFILLSKKHKNSVAEK